MRLFEELEGQEHSMNFKIIHVEHISRSIINYVTFIFTFSLAEAIVSRCFY